MCTSDDGSVQVTLLKCGGVVLTSCFHRAIVDATGIFHFMQTWSRLARGLDAAEAAACRARGAVPRPDLPPRAFTAGVGYRTGHGRLH